MCSTNRIQRRSKVRRQATLHGSMLAEHQQLGLGSVQQQAVLVVRRQSRQLADALTCSISLSQKEADFFFL